MINLAHKPRIQHTLRALSLAGIICGCPASYAANVTWDRGAGTNNFSDALNWSTNALPASVDTLVFDSSLTPNAAQTISVSGTQTLLGLSLNNTGLRSILITGGVLNFQRLASAGTQPSVTSNASALRQPLTISSNILVSAATHSDAAILSFTSGNADFVATINGNIYGTTGGGSRELTKSSAGTLVINGSNSLDKLNFSRGEIIAGSETALGAGWVQASTGASPAILSLASNVTVNNTTSVNPTLSLLTTTEIQLRINEVNSVDRTLTMVQRISTSDVSGRITMVSNVNSTGNLILDLQYSGNVVQNVPIATVAGSIVRLSGTGTGMVYGTSGNGSGVISGAGNVELTGGGTTTFTAANSYTGKTTLSNNSTLALSGTAALASSRIIIGQGSTLLLTGLTATTMTIGSSQVLEGGGNVIGVGKSLTVEGTLTPGSGVGQLSTISNIWKADANYNWQVHDAEGTAGIGYDTLFITGSLDLTNLSETAQFNLNLSSLSGLTTNGDAINFDSSKGFAWTIVSTTGGIIGFDAGSFSINTGAFNGSAGFSNPLDGQLFSIDRSGNDLVLYFNRDALIPEPSSVALLVGGVGLLLAGIRKRRP